MFHNVPYLFTNEASGKVYTRRKFLGAGKFATCFEVMDIQTKQTFAGKIVPKNCLANEIAIHKDLNHPDIVKLYSFFPTKCEMFIVMELCKKDSMLQLQRRRKSITEYEGRYYLYHILKGVEYLQNNRIIHRDLKLENIFLDDRLNVKIGDFGFAVRVKKEGDLLKHICGTPLYMAPEIIKKKGYSYEVDIWSVGCSIHGLLVGFLPFKGRNGKELYENIINCPFQIPGCLSEHAGEIIAAMLRKDPKNRATIQDLLKSKFFTDVPVPESLPESCYSKVPNI